MAHFSESLCEEVIRTEGKCGLTRNEMTQMARFALRAIRGENPWMRDGLRYKFLRDSENAFPLCFIAQRAAPPNIVVQFTGEAADRHIDAMMGGHGDAAHSQTKEKP